MCACIYVRIVRVCVGKLGEEEGAGKDVEALER